MSKDDYLYRPLEGPRLVETIHRGKFLHRRDPFHEALARTVISERKRREASNKHQLS